MSKCSTFLFSGLNPPTFPSKKDNESEPAFMKRLDFFGKYYVTIFQPWCVRTGMIPQENLSFKGFCNLVQSLHETSPSHILMPPFVNQRRLEQIENFSLLLKHNSQYKDLLSAMRGRCKTWWNKDNTSCAPFDNREDNVVNSVIKDINEVIAISSSEKSINLKVQRNNSSNGFIQIIKEKYLATLDAYNNTRNGLHSFNPNDYVCNTSKLTYDSISKMGLALSRPPSLDYIGSLQDNPGLNIDNLSNECIFSRSKFDPISESEYKLQYDKWLADCKMVKGNRSDYPDCPLTNEQRTGPRILLEHLDRLVAWRNSYKTTDMPESPLIFLYGGGGTGKSTIINTLYTEP